MGRLLLCLIVLALGGCAGAPVMSDFAEAPGGAASGDVSAFSDLLEVNRGSTVVFVHGIGDTCPGYALDPTFGWLSNATAASLGLTVSDPNEQVTPVDIPISEFLKDHEADPNFKLTYITRHYTYSDRNGQHRIRAVEITWSQLTQWLKTTQLGFDLTGPVSPPPSEVSTCPSPIPANDMKPPAREFLNRPLKEGLIDRNMADAVLYIGLYGKVMRRGVAETLCRALGGAADVDHNGKLTGNLCHWPSTPANESFLFITHSLGGRLLYDTLLGLSGKDVNPSPHEYDHAFTNAEVARSKGFVLDLALKSRGAYMMANQLAFLGLADVDENHFSTTGPAPALRSVAEFGKLRMRAAQENVATNRNAGEPAVLPVVAFSDTNDLLSWSIPRWYQPAIKVTNVYVQNSVHWLGAFEDPGAAHLDYPKNPYVWKIIICGAKGGVVSACASGAHV